ncbi:MAG TPA: acyl transferase [Bacteroidia bacterium]|nr:acyl transferase [Bacteroidia bacterium]HRS58221.1 acyl transferase [Bacteroidia bacterium]
MLSNDKFKAKIFSVSKENFVKTAIEIFRFQYNSNAVYRQFVDHLQVNPLQVHSVREIPFMPVSFFRFQQIKCGNWDAELVFRSSGTSGMEHSYHFVRYAEWYQESFMKCFELFYGKPENFVLLALLPSYLEQTQSSLIYMVNSLMKKAGKGSAFFSFDFKSLNKAINWCKKNNKRILLLGVTYALLDFSEHYHPDLCEDIVMETGGMKGRKTEMPREEVHEILCNRFHCRTIHSEYGMTELLSQAYSKGGGVFYCPPWMKVLIRDVYDPCECGLLDTSGYVNIIDLANVFSCSFIAVDDAGIAYADGSFRITGRADASPVRGCSLMYV